MRRPKSTKVYRFAELLQQKKFTREFANLTGYCESPDLYRAHYLRLLFRCFRCGSAETNPNICPADYSLFVDCLSGEEGRSCWDYRVMWRCEKCGALSEIVETDLPPIY